MATINSGEETPSGLEPARFKYVYYREETILGPMQYQQRLKPSVWGGLETVVEVVQSRELVQHYFGLAANHTFKHLTTYSSDEPDVVYGGVYKISGGTVEFTISDGDRLTGYLRAEGREMVVLEKVYTLLE